MKLNFILLGFLFCSLFCFGQNLKLARIDSLLQVSKKQKEDTTLCKTYAKISDQYIYLDSKKGIFYAQKALVIAQKLGWETGIGNSYMNIGMHLVSMGKYDKAFQNFKIAELHFKKLSNPFYISKLYNEIGILQANQGKYPEALDYFYKSLQGFEKIKNKSGWISVASSYENIGTIYNLTNSYDQAIRNYEKAITISKKLKHSDLSIALNEANIGSILQKQNKLTQAIIAFENAEKIVKNHQDDFALAFINNGLGSVYLELENYELSHNKSQKALQYVRKIGDKELTTSTIQNIGYALLKKGFHTRNDSDLKMAFQNISKSIEMYHELGNIDGLRKGYMYLSEYYSHIKEFENAYKNYKKYSSYNDSIFNNKNRQSLKNLENQRTIELNNKEIQLNKITISNKEKQKWFFISGLLLLAVIGLLFFYQSRNRKKTNEKLRVLNHNLDLANKAKTRFFSILNHDLRGPVANLIFFLQLQKESPELLDEESIQRMQDKTMSGAENLLNSMEDILQWSKSQMENFQPQPKNIAVYAIFEDTRKHFESDGKANITFLNPDNLQINTDEDYLKTILRNLTGNAIKALDDVSNPTIIWKAWQENNQTLLSIADNGKGASNDHFKALYDDKEVVGIKTGLGLHLIRDLAKAIDCSIAVDSISNKGTTITLSFT
jgi:signal transduction histidine kinase/Tfp pilus assembly protein PilF